MGHKKKTVFVNLVEKHDLILFMATGSESL